MLGADHERLDRRPHEPPDPAFVSNTGRNHPWMQAIRRYGLGRQAAGQLLGEEDVGELRTEHDFILEVCETIIKEGARFVTLCDTVGFALPWEFGKLVADVKQEFPQARISAHCHDDLGLAVANALEGLRNGAERVDTCINGLGERAGNAATEDVVMAIRTRTADLGLDVKVDTTKLIPTSRLVARLSGMQPQWTKSVVGANAFAHGGGIHQDGVLKDARTYEIMTPESIGLTSADRRMYMGKLSGRAALAAQMRDLGYQLEKDQLNRAFDMAKLLLGKKKVLEEMDMRYIAESTMTRRCGSRVWQPLSCLSGETNL